MKEHPLATPLGQTATFRLSLLGTQLTRRFAAAIEDLQLKPKHVGLLALLASAEGRSQRELAQIMEVAPSLVVALVDDLEALGAAWRVQAQHDRRRQEVTITPTGRELLSACGQRASTLDRELFANLDDPQQRSLLELLGHLLADVAA